MPRKIVSTVIAVFVALATWAIPKYLEVNNVITQQNSYWLLNTVYIGAFIVVCVLLWGYWKNLTLMRGFPKWIYKNYLCMRYNPNFSYSVTKIELFDDNGFSGFTAKLNFTITNKNKPLKIDLTGICLVVTQVGSNPVFIGNSGLSIEDLLPKMTKSRSNITLTTSPSRIVGVIMNPPNLSKPYNVSIRGIYVIYNKSRKELIALQKVKSENVK